MPHLMICSFPSHLINQIPLGVFFSDKIRYLNTLKYVFINHVYVQSTCSRWELRIWRSSFAYPSPYLLCDFSSAPLNWWTGGFKLFQVHYFAVICSSTSPLSLNKCCLSNQLGTMLLHQYCNLCTSTCLWFTAARPPTVESTRSRSEPRGSPFMSSQSSSLLSPTAAQWAITTKCIWALCISVLYSASSSLLISLSPSPGLRVFVLVLAVCGGSGRTTLICFCCGKKNYPSSAHPSTKKRTSRFCRSSCRENPISRRSWAQKRRFRLRRDDFSWLLSYSGAKKQ